MIPREIHLVWIDKFIDAPDHCQEIIRKWESVEGFTVKKWEQDDVIKLMSKDELGAYSSLDSIIKKSDFARLVVMRENQGFYLDCDLEPLRDLGDLYRGFVEVPNSKTTHEEVPFSMDLDLLFVREWGQTTRVANGFFAVSEEGSKVIGRFLNQNYKLSHNKVLKYLGPHALSVFIAREAKEKRLPKTKILMPHLILFEKECPEYAYCRHVSKNSWGDKTRKDWWNI